MIVVKSVEVVEINAPRYTIPRTSLLRDAWVSTDGTTAMNDTGALYHYDNSERQCSTEIIEGTEFVNAYGEHVIIGWAEDVQLALGLPFEVFDTDYQIFRKRERKSEKRLRKLSVDCAKLENENAKLKKKMKKYERVWKLRKIRV